jgi:hypothetical protein
MRSCIGRVEILQEAFRKTYKDPEFRKEYKKIAAADATPLMPEAHEKVIREIRVILRLEKSSKSWWAPGHFRRGRF